MFFRRRNCASGFTLLELLLVVGMLALISAIAIPTFFAQAKREQLPTSARQLQALVTLTRANAQFDGKRFRIRFLTEEELEDEEFEWVFNGRQPIVEREDDPLEEPGVYNPIKLPWARDETFLGKVRCAEVRVGKPTVAQLQERLDNPPDELDDAKIEAFKDFDFFRPPLLIEPDGTISWVTFVLTEAPDDVEIDELDDEVRIEVLFDGTTGLSWLQRPFYEEELDLFEEKGWPAVLRQDLLDPKVLTEDDVLEVLDIPVPEGALP